jgi:hypothetical protein
VPLVTIKENANKVIANIDVRSKRDIVNVLVIAMVMTSMLTGK